MALIDFKNIGAYLKLAKAGVRTDVTAAGTGDNTLVNGNAVDLTAVGYPKSCVLAFDITATQANTQTLALTYAVQDSADNGNWNNFSTPVTNSAVITGNAGGTAQNVMLQVNVDLNGARQYIRCAYTPDLSRTGTDTANIVPMFVLGGMAEIPA